MRPTRSNNFCDAVLFYVVLDNSPVPLNLAEINNINSEFWLRLTVNLFNLSTPWEAVQIESVKLHVLTTNTPLSFT